MPFPDEHAARVKTPDLFQPGSFRRKNIREGIDMILGKLEGETTMTTESYRFKADVFTAEEAKRWLKDHKIDYVLFEPAEKQADSRGSLAKAFYEHIRV